MDRVDVYMPLYVRDFLTATIGWTAEERGHYLVLLMLQWDRGALPVELDGLERLSPGVSKCWAIVEPKFPVNADVGRQNPKLEEHRARCLELKSRRSQAAQSAATRRWSSDASRIADASQTHSKNMPSNVNVNVNSRRRDSTGCAGSHEQAGFAVWLAGEACRVVVCGSRVGGHQRRRSLGVA